MYSLSIYIEIIKKKNYKEKLIEQNKNHISKIDQKIKTDFMKEDYADFITSKSVILCNEKSLKINSYFEEEISLTLSEFQNRKNSYLIRNKILSGEIFLLDMDLKDIEYKFIKLSQTEMDFINEKISQLKNRNSNDKLTTKARRMIKSIDKKLGSEDNFL